MALASQAVRQAAAIPFKGDQLCLVTSRSGKRWVVPKGTMEPGKTSGEIALQEAWEEAGLTGVLHREPVGTYLYEKLGSTHHVVVYVMRVTEVAGTWPEDSFRQREWLSIAEALERIEDEGLREIVERVNLVAAGLSLRKAAT
jgi:8-oxo-dGTP pyrophosphatase MutT (NUDIX family)